ncbi:MAG: DHH family phosphoesterase [Oscillospiraceae bacterium]
MTRAEFCAFLREHDNFVILTHRRPDGDTIGCASALVSGPAAAGEVGGRAAETSSSRRASRPLLEGLACEDAPADACVISTDIASEGLLSFDAVRLGLTPVCAVDHHGSNSLACPKLVEADKAACGEIVHALLDGCSA